MLKHVYECLNEEKIGKFHNKGCKDLHQWKSSFAKAANSIAKRLFSYQALKRRPQARRPPDVLELEVHESIFQTACLSSELEANWYGNPVDMYGVETSAELEVFDDSMHFSADEIFQRGILSEVGNGV
jgi:hypothetical protein